jgi:hypothetical protein
MNASLPRRTEMTALPAQTANPPLLHNSIQQHSDNLTPESSRSSPSDLRLSKGKLNDALKLMFPDDRVWSVASIVGGVVIAVALAVGHHTVLRYLHGRNIDEYPQLWIKGANNGFSNIFSILVGFSASSALTQIVRLLSCFYAWPVYLMMIAEMASFRQRTVANVHHR